jgi:prepilin-type N-terminal cleavage/methylation domain-containing protein
MRSRATFPSLARRAVSARGEGFTLPELLISITVFSLLVAGVVFSHLYGLSMFHITEIKLNATDGARKMIGKMADELRTCNSAWVGNVQNGAFEAVLDGETQEGAGLLIHPTTNNANFVIYFVDPSDQTLRRTTSTPGSAIIVARSVTNNLVFRAQDHLGNVLTNNRNNRVIHVNLEFHQTRRHLQIADHYKFETSVTRRAE